MVTVWKPLGNARRFFHALTVRFSLARTGSGMRLYCADDAHAVAQVFHESVQYGTRAFYTVAQRDAWSGPAPTPDLWIQRLAGRLTFVADYRGKVVGFITVSDDGFVDFAYVAPSHLGGGTGWQLYQAMEGAARAQDIRHLTTDASLTARPFFERQGWHVVAAQAVVRRGVSLPNYRMTKPL
jgi:putative acetyltransferase